MNKKQIIILICIIILIFFFHFLSSFVLGLLGFGTSSYLFPCLDLDSCPTYEEKHPIEAFIVKIVPFLVDFLIIVIGVVLFIKSGKKKIT